MQERGVEVLDFHELLGEALDDKEARAFVLDRRMTPNTVGPGAARAMRPWLDEMPAPSSRGMLIGGIAMQDVPKSEWSKMLTRRGGRRRRSSFRRSPTRSSSATPPAGSMSGVTCNPMYWPARQPETLLQRAVYKFHPIFKGGDFNFWFGDSDEDFATATLEGGDVMPIGKGVVLIGMGERTTRQAVSQVAASLFAHNAATRVIACLMPKSRAAMHLDTVFSFCDRDVCTVFREVVDQIHCYSWYPANVEGGIEVRKDNGTMLEVVQRGARPQGAARRRDRRRRLGGRARAVG